MRAPPSALLAVALVLHALAAGALRVVHPPHALYGLSPGGRSALRNLHVGEQVGDIEYDPVVEPQEAPQSASRGSLKRLYTIFIVRAAAIGTLALVPVVLYLLYNALHETLAERVGLQARHLCCVVFVVAFVATDISIKQASVANGGHYTFQPGVAVTIVELCKLLTSAGLLAMKRKQKVVPASTQKAGSDSGELPTLGGVALLMTPAVFYTFDSILAYYAMAGVPLATVGVVRQTRLVWSALIWMVIFRTPISCTRWIAIVGIIIACVLSQVPAMLSSEYTSKVWLVVLLAFMSSASIVFHEYVIKSQAGVDLNLQNVILYASGVACALVYLAIVKISVFSSPAAFFEGVTPECLQVIVLQVFLGLTISRILKYVESVTKGIMSSLSSIVTIFVGSALLHTHLKAAEILAAAVASAFCLLYLSQGPLVHASREPLATKP